MSGQNNGLTPNDIFSSKVEKFNDDIKMIYYRTSNNNANGGRIQKAPFGTNNAKESSNFNQKLNVKILT